MLKYVGNEPWIPLISWKKIERTDNERIMENYCGDEYNGYQLAKSFVKHPFVTTRRGSLDDLSMSNIDTGFKVFSFSVDVSWGAILIWNRPAPPAKFFSDIPGAANVS